LGDCRSGTAALVNRAKCSLVSALRASIGYRGEVLAWEPATDDIGNNSVCSEPVGGKLSDISINRNLGPMFVEDANGERLDLAERDSLEPARALQAQVEAANACEEAEHAQWD
jgi:hypothetical protein